MFCPKCGHELEPNAAFCGNCGESVADVASSTCRAPDPVQENNSSSTSHDASAAQVSSVKPKHATGIVSIALIIISLLPWVSFDAYILRQSVSLPELFQLAARLSSYESYFSSDAYMMLATVAVLLGFVWLIMVCVLVSAAYQSFRHGKETQAGYVTALLSVAVVLIGWGGIDASISQGSNSTLGVAVSGVVSATVWPWAAGIASVVMLVLQSKDGK